MIPILACLRAAPKSSVFMSAAHAPSPCVRHPLSTVSGDSPRRETLPSVAWAVVRLACFTRWPDLGGGTFSVFHQAVRLGRWYV